MRLTSLRLPPLAFFCLSTWVIGSCLGRGSETAKDRGQVISFVDSSFKAKPRLGIHLNWIERAFLVRDNRVFNGQLGSRSFARTTHCAVLRFAPLASLYSLTHSVHGFAHSLRSLPRGTVEILEYVLKLGSRFTGTNAFFSFTRNTPLAVNGGVVTVVFGVEGFFYGRLQIPVQSF